MGLNGVNGVKTAMKTSEIRLDEGIFFPVPKQNLKLVPAPNALNQIKFTANLAATIMDLSILREAERKRYLLVIDFENFLPKKGWYRIDRKVDSGSVTFVSVSHEESGHIRDEGRKYDILYVRESAVEAADQKHPVTLDVYPCDPQKDGKGWCLFADNLHDAVPKGTAMMVQTDEMSIRTNLMVLETMFFILRNPQVSDNVANNIVRAFVGAARQ